MKESELQKAIIEFLRFKGHYCQRVNSGKMLKGYIDKHGNKKMHAIQLADLGTPDVLACINGVFIGIEIKKDEKEVLRWAKIVEKFKKTAYIPISHQREVAQSKEHDKIMKAGGHTLIVGSMKEFENDYNSLIKEHAT